MHATNFNQCDIDPLLFKNKQSPVLHVLNGDYPADAIERMSNLSLRRLVAKLIECTARLMGQKEIFKDKPKWWPNEVFFDKRIKFPINSHEEAKLILVELIINCTQFFKIYNIATKWPLIAPEEDGVVSLRRKEPSGPSQARCLDKLASFQPYVILHRPEKPPSPPPTKQQFLNYLGLDQASLDRSPLKLMVSRVNGNRIKMVCQNSNIPFSSEVGKVITRKQRLTEELILKRIERNEWYINKPGLPSTSSYREHSNTNEFPHVHLYKVPRRQFWQKCCSLHSVEFFAQFCRPLKVYLNRIDVKRIKKNLTKVKRPIVMLERNPKIDEMVKNNMQQQIIEKPIKRRKRII